MEVYVITNPELGWDCVCAVVKAKSEEEALDKFRKSFEDYDLEYDEEFDNYIAHYETLLK